MKTIEYYMNLPYRLELVPDTDEGGFVASYPELRGCLTSGETAEAALKNALDCKREWLAAALEDGYEIPEPRLTRSIPGSSSCGFRSRCTAHLRKTPNARVSA